MATKKVKFMLLKWNICIYKFALCWLKLVPRRPKWLLKAFQVLQDEASMGCSGRVCFLATPESTFARKQTCPKNNGKHVSGSESRKNDFEAKTFRFGSHLGAILASSWGAWEAFGGHFGRLGTNLSQHKAILSHLGANLRPP